MAGSIQPRSMNWVSTPSAWSTLETWRQKHRAMTQQFLSDADSLNSVLTSVWSNQISGQAQLSGQAALKRVQDAAKAKAASLGVNLDV